jgi:drug/metabolite transporter (DMT)-like permease
MTDPSARNAVLLALASAALFGAATPLSKWLLGSLGAFQLAGLLYLGAALAVAPFALAASSRMLLRGAEGRRNVVRLAAAVVCGGVLGPVLLLTGLETAGAAPVALWLNLELVATAALGVIFFRDHLHRHAWWGVALATAAAVVLSVAGGAAGWRAGLFVFAACLCWGLDNHFTALIDGLTPSQSTFVKGAVAGSVNFALGTDIAPLPDGATTYASALAVGAASYGVSIVLYIRSAQRLGATRAQVYFSSAPIFGVLLAVLGLGEPLTWTLLLAGVLFGAGVALLLREAHAHVHAHAPMTHSHSHRHDDAHHDHEHAGLPASTRHTHVHTHGATVHSHVHVPDLHHRHAHARTRGGDE